MASYGGGGGGAARDMVSGPATGLMALGGLDIALQAAVLVGNVMILGMDRVDAAKQGGTMYTAMTAVEGMGYVVAAIVGIVVNVVIIMGAQKMRSLSSYSFAMSCAILAMIPCVSPLCFLGLPIGMWTILVINRPAVKASFMG